MRDINRTIYVYILLKTVINFQHNKIKKNETKNEFRKQKSKIEFMRGKMFMNIFKKKKIKIK